MNRLHICLLLFVLNLCSCNILRNSNNLTRILVIVPQAFEGKTVIHFEQKGYPSLKKGPLGCVAFLNSNEWEINTSTSLSRFDTVIFDLIRLKQDSTIYFDSTLTINYHYYYSPSKNSNLIGDFKEKKFYVGFFYKEYNNSSRDSLIQFLKTINADTLDIH
jgi:hypothetical protein